MLELIIIFFIYVVGVPYSSGTDAAAVPAPDAAAIPAPDAAAVEQATEIRTPEPQDPTGKFLNATEVRPILDATKASWVAVRLYEGQDLLYFTNLLTWRCGFWEIRYGINGAPADQVLAMEPCHVDTAQPGGITDPVGFPIYLTFEPDSVQSVTVEIDYDDGTTDAATFERNGILIP